MINWTVWWFFRVCDFAKVFISLKQQKLFIDIKQFFQSNSYVIFWIEFMIIWWLKFVTPWKDVNGPKHIECNCIILMNIYIEKCCFDRDFFSHSDMNLQELTVWMIVLTKRETVKWSLIICYCCSVNSSNCHPKL